MDYIGMLKGKTWVEISEDFDYLRATKEFLGLKLFPMFKTENMKLAIADFVKGADVPVMALVHALDTEAKIGDRPDFKEINFEMLLVKEKLDQGEALRKKIRDMGMSKEERAIIEAVYNDAANLISRVLTRFEVMACELLSSGQVTVKENNLNLTIDYHLPEENHIVVKDWATASHDILGDLAKVKQAGKGRIVRAICTNKVMGYILNNSKMADLAAKQGVYVTEDFAKGYIQNYFGIEFVVYNGTYKTGAKETVEKNFFDEDAICFLTTRGAVGKTFMTSTPEEDAGLAQYSQGYVSVYQYVASGDPVGIFTKASGLGLPVPQDVKQIYVCKVNA